LYNVLEVNAVERRAYAKINLSLEVIGRRTDGYHLVDMILQRIDLCDLVRMEKRDRGIVLTCDDPSLPTDGQNLAYRAAALFLEETGLEVGVAIHIEKRIPVAAGLAGGSADAAEVLLGMRELYGVAIDDARLMEMGLRLGADVPYCMGRGTQRAQGIGERLSPVIGLDRGYILLTKPEEGVSTKEAYGNLPAGSFTDGRWTTAMERALATGDLRAIAGALHNTLELSTVPVRPEIADLKEVMMGNGALGALMSGSGPTVFGLFEEEAEARAAFEVCKRLNDQTYMVRPIDGGVFDV
jgi:4-diphosphocytidyl-2-C-methyl-D-erythritol kinase